MTLRDALAAITGDPASETLVQDAMTREGVRPSAMAKYGLPDLDSEPKAVKEDKVPKGEVRIRGPIVSKGMASMLRKYGEEATSATDFEAALAAAGDEVTIRINSPGGSVFQAAQMVNAIVDARKDGKTVNTVVDGIAASAAAVLFLMGDKREMYAFSELMYHKAFSAILVVGDADMVRREAASVVKMLSDFDKQQADLVAKVTDLDEKGAEALFADGDAFLAAGESVEKGFATAQIEDEPKDEPKAAARLERAHAVLTRWAR